MSQKLSVIGSPEDSIMSYVFGGINQDLRQLSINEASQTVDNYVQDLENLPKPNDDKLKLLSGTNKQNFQMVDKEETPKNSMTKKLILLDADEVVENFYKTPKMAFGTLRTNSVNTAKKDNVSNLNVVKMEGKNSTFTKYSNQNNIDVPINHSDNFDTNNNLLDDYKKRR